MKKVLCILLGIFIGAIFVYGAYWIRHAAACAPGMTARLHISADLDGVYADTDAVAEFASLAWNHLPTDVEFKDYGFRILTAGKYRITGSVVVTQIGGSRRVDVYIRRNGKTAAADNEKNRIYSPGVYEYGTYHNLIGKVGRIFDARVNDVFQLVVNHNETDGWRTIGGGVDETYLEIQCVGE